MLNLSQRCKNYLLEEPNEEHRRQIEALLKANDEESQKELEDRLGRNCHFGTAGLRARMEAGYSRMNLVSIFRFSHALAQDLLALEKKPVVVIGFDGRNNSSKFAEEAAQIFGCLGLKVHIFKDLVPTPLTAFATKYLKASAGIMITASHNPAFDNGVKVFSSCGAQLSGPRLKNLEQLMEQAPSRKVFLEKAPSIVPARTISPEVFNSYLSEIKSTRLFKNHELDHSINFVYTPLHGVGKEFFKEAIKQEGFSNIHVVDEQACPDGNFPSVVFPNPEEEHTLDKAQELAKNSRISWVFAHDPDADRLQVSCLSGDDFVKLSGNEMGVILGYFAIIKALELKTKPLVASSIVSSRMLKSMAEALNAKYIDGLTGFSNIVDKAMKAQKQNGCQFIFGYEEAIGFLVGQVVLDKDGINAGVRFLEVAAFLSQSQKSIWQLLDELYLKFGVFVSSQWSKRFDGIEAMNNMNNMMKTLRVEHKQVCKLFDDSECNFYDLAFEQENNCYAGLLADVLIFESKEMRLIIRPSGTEPKIKFYLELMDRADNQKMLNNKRAKLAEKIVRVKENFSLSFAKKGF